VLGHVDHGKTTLIQYMQGTIVSKLGMTVMTQHIGATFMPIKDILDFCGPSGQKIADKLVIPGLLVIDTPGHSAFINLRKRGGAVANIAILVIEVSSGPQVITWEAVRILRERKVPFVIALNKIDRLSGWKTKPNAKLFREAYAAQAPSVQEDLDNAIYSLIHDFNEEGFKGIDRFDRIKDFAQNVAVVPVSAITGEGMPDLMLVIIGLVQQFLQKNIAYTDGPAKGVVLEIKKTEGLGTTADCIIYDGYIKKNDQVIFGTLDEPLETKVKVLLMPKPKDEVRDPRYKFNQVDIVYAAAGIKIAAQTLEGVVAGSPFQVIWSNAEKAKVKEQIMAEMNEIHIDTDEHGVVLKADSIGSLEAIVKIFKDGHVKIRRATIGDIIRKDVVDTATTQSDDPLLSVILAFNVKVLPDAQEEAENQGVRIFTSDVVYRLLDDYKEWVQKRQEEEKLSVLSALVKPAVLKILPEYVFRRSNPVVMGVRVEKGTLAPKLQVINQNGELVGKIHQIQENNESVKEASKGREVAVSINDVTFGRQVKETDTLYVQVPEAHVRVLRTKFRDQIRPDELDALMDYIAIMKKKHGAWWGI